MSLLPSHIYRLSLGIVVSGITTIGLVSPAAASSIGVSQAQINGLGFNPPLVSPCTSNTVTAPLGANPVTASCAAVDNLGSDFAVNAFTNGNGVLNVGGGFVQVVNEFVTIETRARVEHDSVMINEPSQSSGFLRVIAHPSGEVTFTCTSTSTTSAGQCSGDIGFGGAVGVNGNIVQVMNGSPIVNLSPAGGTFSSASYAPTILGFVDIFTSYNTPIDWLYSLNVTITTTSVSNARFNMTYSISDPPIVQILDLNKNLLPNATITSASGIDYTGAAVPTAPDNTPVPEPTTLTLLGFGVGIPALRRKLRRRGC
jgi:hypothetical protein